MPQAIALTINSKEFAPTRQDTKGIWTFTEKGNKPLDELCVLTVKADQKRTALMGRVEIRLSIPVVSVNEKSGQKKIRTDHITIVRDFPRSLNQTEREANFATMAALVSESNIADVFKTAANFF